jgi:hypothetical protein
MFFKTSQKRFPNLCMYVDHAVSRQTTTGEEIGAVSMMTLAGLAVPGAIILGFVMAMPVMALLAAGVGAASGFGAWRSFRKIKAGTDPLEAEAAEANQLLNEALKRGKLHRVAGEPTTNLLEECARHWSRARLALDSAFWSSTSLPPHYKSVRDQTSRAADRAMDEAVVLLHNELEMPYKAGLADKFSVSELVEGIFGVQLPDPNSALAPLPFAYHSVRQLAEKLRDLADNVENLTREVAEDPLIRSEFHADTALDLAISELQSIRQAETELRQNITG